MMARTFSVAIFLPMRIVSRLLVLLAGLFLGGDLARLGLRRPSHGRPLEPKNTKGRTPVLDIGALDKIHGGEINIVPGGSDFFLEQPASTMGATPSTQDPSSSSSYCYLHRRRRGFPLLLLLGLMYIFFLCSSFPAVSRAQMPGRTMVEMDSEKVRVRLCVRLPPYECSDPPQCNCCFVTELCYATMAECIIQCKKL